MSIQAFHGVWAFDPARAVYPDDQPVPESAVYTILPDGEGLFFHARWRAGGDPLQVAFRSSLGTPTAGAEGAEMATELVGGALVTEVRRDGVAVHTATRTLVDGELHVHQRIMGAGGWSETQAVYTRTSTKQVLLYRRDLKMRKGKIAAQTAHASMGVFFRRNKGSAGRLEVPLDGPMAAWVQGRFTKICLSVDDEPALLAAHDAAVAAGIPCALITDAGKTEFGGVPTRTALAIGPAAIPEIDAITGPGGLVACKLA